MTFNGNCLQPNIWPSKSEIIIVKNTKNSTFGHFKSVLHIWFQLFFFNLTSHLSFSYLILSTFILSYLLAFNHLVLNLHKSHKQNLGGQDQAFVFCSVGGSQKNVCLCLHSCLYQADIDLSKICFWTFYYKLIVSNDETCLSMAKNW